MQEDNFLHRTLNHICSLPWVAHTLAKQLRCPSGILANWIGNELAQVNKDINLFAVDTLNMQSEDHVLEIGFGPGVGIGAMLKQIDKGSITGIETSQSMIDMVSKKHSDAIEDGSLILSPNTQDELQLPENTYNAVLAIHVLYFQKDAKAFLQTIYRGLKSNGTLCIGIEPKQSNQNYNITKNDVFTLYTPEDIIDLLVESGWQQEHCSVYEHPKNPAVCILARKF